MAEVGDSIEERVEFVQFEEWVAGAEQFNKEAQQQAERE